MLQQSRARRQIVRDPSSRADCGGDPAVAAIGYGINLDSSKRGGDSAEQQVRGALISLYADITSPYIDATISDNRHELPSKNVRTHSRTGGDSGGFRAANGARRDSAPIQVITDGAVRAKPPTSFLGYVGRHLATGNSSGRKDRGDTFEPLIDVQTRYWFNPAAIVSILWPLRTIIMTVIGATTAGRCPRMERGTMEALFQPK